MKLQQVADDLWQATELAKRLPDSPEKFDVLAVLTQARSDLTRFGEAMMATLDNYEAALKSR